MDPTQLSDDQLDDLAAQLAPRLPTGTHGDRVVLSRRQFAAAATGTLGAGALMALGVDEASAQAAGQQGTASSPNDMFAYDLNVANAVTSALPMNGNNIENAGSVSTGEMKTTNETMIRVQTDLEVTAPANTYTSPSWGTILTDRRNEFSTSQFTPDKSGFYLISYVVRAKQANVGEEIQGRIRNVTDGVDVVSEIPETGENQASNDTFSVSFTMVLEFNAGKNYEIQLKQVGGTDFIIDDVRGEMSITSVYQGN